LSALISDEYEDIDLVARYIVKCRGPELYQFCVCLWANKRVIRDVSPTSINIDPHCIKLHGHQ